jgi:hypothetical protein
MFAQLDADVPGRKHHVGYIRNGFSGNFLFDFRTSTLSIDGTAFLGKVLVDFAPHGSQ